MPGNKKRRVTGNFAECTQFGGNHGAAAGHGFDDWHAEPLIERGIDQGLSTRVRASKLIVRQIDAANRYIGRETGNGIDGNLRLSADTNNFKFGLSHRTRCIE